MAEVILRDLVKLYGREVAVRGIDLDIPDGAFVVLVGPSGCGKSTTLRMIAGLESISHGELRIGGRRVNDLDPQDRGVAMVFQSYALYPHMTVAENLSFSLKLAKVPEAEARVRIDRAVSALELTPYLARRPSELSGGQRQRVAMGRAIVREPEVFLFDEPLSNLKDGVIAQTGSPLDVFERPADRFVAGFIGTPQMNFVEGTLRQETGNWRFEGAGLAVPLDPARFAELEDCRPVTLGLRPEDIVPDGHGLRPPGRPVTLGLRPEDIVPDGHGLRPPGEVTLAATVTLSEMLGNETLLFAEAEAASFVSRMQQPRPVADGERLTFHVNAGRCHLFDQATGKTLAKSLAA